MSLIDRSVNKTFVLAIAVALLGTAFAGCVAGDGEGSAAFFVKDAPSDEFAHVNVTFSQVQLHQAAAENGTDNATDEEEDGSWITVVDSTHTVDLLNFQEEDSRAFLGEANLSAGTYTQIRVVVDQAVGIDKEDGSEVDIVVSSGTVKVVKPFDVTAGERTDVTLDVDLDRSLRQQGNDVWRMTPVIGKVIVQEGATGTPTDQADDGTGEVSDGGDGDTTEATGEASGQGQVPMTTYVKDAPTDEFEEIWIAFDQVQVHWAGNGSEDEAEDDSATDEDETETEDGNATDENETDTEDGGAWITTFNDTREIDLLRFNETGAKAFLGETNVPPGQYTQIRVNITEAWGIQDGNRTNITVASGTARVNHPFTVDANATVAQVVIDIDLDRSLKERGGQGWLMTPVIGSVQMNHVDEDPRADQDGNAAGNSADGDNGDAGASEEADQDAGASNPEAGGPPAEGEASAYVKDAPTDEFEEIWLNISQVQVHWAGNGSDENATDGEWRVLFNDTREVNLLNFSESASKAFLGNATLPVGTYTQIRLSIADAWGIQDGDRTNITVSSDTAKIVRPFEVTENATAQVVIDVDLDQSLVQQGGGPDGEPAWRMTPVIGSVAVDHVDEDPQADQPDPAEA